MAEAIDYFKYKAYLTKLENLKKSGKTKKPIFDFIKELYKVSNTFSNMNDKYEEQPETLRYAVMLTAKALTYNTSKTDLPRKYKKEYEMGINRLFIFMFLTPENINETFENIGKLPRINISTFEEVDYFNELLKVFKHPGIKIGLSITKYYYFSKNQSISWLYVKSKYSNSPILDYLEKPSDKSIEEAMEETESINNSLNLILKEQTNEYDSTSSEEHY